MLLQLEANNGLSNSSSPLCADVEILTPCTQEFKVIRYVKCVRQLWACAAVWVLMCQILVSVD